MDDAMYIATSSGSATDFTAAFLRRIGPPAQQGRAHDRQRTQAGGRGDYPQEGLLEIKKLLEQGASSKIAIARDQVGDSIAALRIRCMSLSASTLRMIFTPRSPSSRSISECGIRSRVRTGAYEAGELSVW
jgi:hypothetical protein